MSCTIASTVRRPPFNPLVRRQDGGLRVFFVYFKLVQDDAGARCLLYLRGAADVVNMSVGQENAGDPWFAPALEVLQLACYRRFIGVARIDDDRFLLSHQVDVSAVGPRRSW